MTENSIYDVFVQVCKPCPVCGKMPILSREYNHMRDGRVRTIFCKERHYFINMNYGEGDSELIDVWNHFVSTYSQHEMGVREKQKAWESKTIDFTIMEFAESANKAGECLRRINQNLEKAARRMMHIEPMQELLAGNTLDRDAGR